MPLFYRSGEEVRLGDHVRYMGRDGSVERVADPARAPDDWYVTEYGGGVLVAEPIHFGRVFVAEPLGEEDLVFVSRAAASTDLPR